MSSVKIIRALLVADTALLAVVPAARVIAGVLPQGTALPSVAVTEVSTVELSRIDAQAVDALIEGRVQVTIFAATYPAQKQLLDLVRKSCNYKRGTVAGLVVSSVRRDSNGPDFNDPAAGFYMQSIDFKVIYHEPN
jgi:hypothetical protein